MGSGERLPETAHEPPVQSQAGVMPPNKGCWRSGFQALETGPEGWCHVAGSLWGGRDVCC